MTQSLLLLILVFVGLTILGALLGLALGAAGRLGLGKRASSVITGVVFAVLALVTGFLGLTLFFSDGPPLTARLIVVAVAYPTGQPKRDARAGLCRPPQASLMLLRGEVQELSESYHSRPRAVKSAGYGIGRVHKASPCAGLSAV